VTAKNIRLFCEKEGSHCEADKADGAKHSDEIAGGANQVKSGHPVNECAMA